MGKILIAQPIREEGVRLLTEAGHEVEHFRGDLNSAELHEAVVDADGMLVRYAVIGRNVIEAGARLKVIARHGAGLETIDLAAATERGVRVTYTPQANSVSVAEHVICLLLALAKNLPRMDAAVRAGDFDIRHRRFATELAGRTLGIVGLGNVGRRVATIAAAMGMRVLAYDPLLDRKEAPEGAELVAERDRVFVEGDYVSLNLPLNEGTRGSIGERELGLMASSACLINCARAAIVDEAALVRALREDLIGGAAIDVYPEEPPTSSLLPALANVILTPHCAAHTDRAMINMAEQAAQGIVDVLAGGEPVWPAN